MFPASTRSICAICVCGSDVQCTMGWKLIILMGLLFGVLYSLHLLAKDYQAITAPRLLRLLFKRDVTPQNFTKPHVRWRRILHHDVIQCARFMYCDLGSRPEDDKLREGFELMLKLEPKEEDKLSLAAFTKAYESGRSNEDPDYCKRKYYTCPFDSSFLFEIMQYLLKTQ